MGYVYRSTKTESLLVNRSKDSAHNRNQYNTIQYNIFISTHTRSLQKKERENNLKIKLDYRYRKEKPKKKLTGTIRSLFQNQNLYSNSCLV